MSRRKFTRLADVPVAKANGSVKIALPESALYLCPEAGR
jgi:hypothetical protein